MFFFNFFLDFLFAFNYSKLKYEKYSWIFVKFYFLWEVVVQVLELSLRSELKSRFKDNSKTKKQVKRLKKKNKNLTL
jgi:hypothetical protein